MILLGRMIKIMMEAVDQVVAEAAVVVEEAHAEAVVEEDVAVAEVNKK